MTKILMTGFQPFNGMDINPSLEAIKRLKDQYGDTIIIKLEVPTVFIESIQIVEKAIKFYHPNIVIMVGQAGGRKGITVERIAINCDDTKIPDNRGNKPINSPIVENGKTAYFSTLPIIKIVDNLQKNDILASISNSAGTYVCNHLMYGILDQIDKQVLPIKAGFIHVPFLHEQTKDSSIFSMSLSEITAALENIINTVTEDIK